MNNSYNQFIDLLYEAKNNDIDIILTEGQLQVKVPKNKSVDAALLERIRNNKKLLIDYLDNERFTAKRTNGNGHTIIPFDRSTIEELPLSFAQERLWFIHQLHGSVQYHLHWVFRLNGELDIDALQSSLQEIVRRHEILRTNIIDKDGKAFQRIRPAEDWRLQFIPATSGLADRESIQPFIDNVVNQPFDLSTDQMMKVWAIQQSETEFVLVFLVHHIAFDGWSIGILVDELVELYRSMTEGRKPALGAIPVQYVDYANWQRQYLADGVLGGKIGYWKQQLQGWEPLDLPTDFARPAIQSSNGAVITKTLGHDVRDAVLAFSRQHGTSLFMSLLTVFKVLLHRYTGQHDLCIGTSIAGRQQHELEKLIGFFVNTLVLRSRIGENMSFAGLLKQVKQTTLDAYDHQEIPFEKIVEALNVERDRSRNPIFQVLFSVQNSPAANELDLGGSSLVKETNEKISAQFDLNLNISENGNGLELHLIYCTDLFTQDTAQRMLEHYEQLLNAVLINADKSITELPLLSEKEQQQLFSYNHTTTTFANTSLTVPELFSAQVKLQPKATAIVFGDVSITYSELNKRANRLANYLLSKGALPGKLIPICFDRGIDMLVAMLGILKSGAGYVPLDPAQPFERTAYMILHAEAKLVLCSQSHAASLTNHTGLDEVIIFEDEAIQQQSAETPDVHIKPYHLAYVLYTSGSTGKPKGVMIEHASMINYLLNARSLYMDHQNANTSGSFVHLSYTFDASLTALFVPLISGKKIVIGKETGTDVFNDKNLLAHAPYDFIKLTPAHLPLLEQANAGTAAKKLVLGGEALQPNQIQFLQDHHVEIFNEYGPTEATVGSTIYHFYADDKNILSGSNGISIGTPMGNTSIFIVDEQLRLVPHGIIGEICIGGVQVARGYVHQPGLTLEKFIDNPFGAGKLYRTGDTARWLKGGNLEYIGRRDEQVKLRGYRVEPGEIETVLQEAFGVKQAAVVVVKGEDGHKRLIGYVVPAKDYDAAQVKSYLQEQLPSYMIPAVIIERDSLPLTINGKIDRKQLQAAGINITSTRQYAAPRNEAEQAMATIWEELLGVQQIGIHDNFFELGGDSIISMQLASRAKKQGYDMLVGDVFSCQTIAALAHLLSTRPRHSTAIATHEDLQGKFNLLPIQEWFLQHNGQGGSTSHYNQSVLLNIDKRLTGYVITTAIRSLVKHHDALRLSFHQSADGPWLQEFGDHVPDVAMEDLREISDADLPAMINELADQYQRSLDIFNGIVFRAVWVRTSSQQEYNRLLMIVHHLAVDGVSWRIILEDLELLFTGFLKGKELSPGAKTHSYQQWQQYLAKYDASSQAAYWQAAKLAYLPLTKASRQYEHTVVADKQHHTAKLSANFTDQLLREVPRAYHTEINGILLAALSSAVNKWSGHEKLVIGLEGHGREAAGTGLDINRTVGWFTSLYPLLLDGSHAHISSLIVSAKEQIRKVPGKGLGYGVLKYIVRDESLQGRDPWDIVFNYLGQTDNIINNNNKGLISPAGEPMGEIMGAGIVQPASIEINSMVSGGALLLNWSYNNQLYTAEAISELANNYIDELQKIIVHCVEVKEPVFTPSDFSLADEISPEDLQEFIQKQPKEVQSICRLSSLQEGVLFHAMYDRSSGAYFQQFSADVDAVDIEKFKQSWQYLVQRHSILRTAFFTDAFRLPVQCVFSNVQMPFAEMDYRSYTAAEQQELVKLYEDFDRRQGFDFSKAPLMRMALIRLSNTSYHMLWTYHHLILDGWSTPMLMEEFLTIYDALVAGQPVPGLPEDRYEDYIRHIERNAERNTEENYWKNYLSEVESATLLPFISSHVDRNKGVEPYCDELLALSHELTESIENYASNNRLTVNAVMQGAWAFLLSRYSGNQRVLFGITVSGRPEGLQNVEQRIGMFTNTIPLQSNIAGEQTVVEWLQEMQRQQLACMDYQYTSLSSIQQWAGIQGDLFDTMITFQNFPMSEVVVSQKWALQVREEQVIEQSSNYPLSLRITISGKETRIQFIYKPSMLEKHYVESIRDHFRNVLQQFVASNEVLVQNINLLTKNEEERLLVELNDTAADFPRNKTITDLFKEQATATPTATAIIDGERSLSYYELDEQSDMLAKYLLQEGITRGTMVPLMVERSIEMIIGILGIMKSGGVYVPIDPQFPEERIRFMLDDCGAGQEQIVLSADIIRNIQSCEAEILPGNANDLAYCIYTSGTTGKPKGVLIEHEGLVNVVDYHIRELNMKPSDKYLQFMSAVFDGSVLDIFSTLVAGATLVLPSRECIQDSNRFLSYMDEVGITMLTVTPSYLSLLNKAPMPSVHTIITAGEACKPEDAVHYSKTKNFFNGYGPTEATINATLYKVDPAQAYTQGVPIGKPAPNKKLFVVDDKLQLVAPGVPGELCIAGTGLARGYLHQPELTAKAFVKNPFGHDLMYRTGDLVKWLPDGTLLYIGRKDEQVKIGGYRIELGEIETALNALSFIQESVVLASASDEEHDAQIFLFYRTSENNVNAAIKEHLTTVLPAYMVPHRMIAVNDWPLTINRKIDKRKLLEIAKAEDQPKTSIAAASKEEIALLNIWKDLLDQENITVEDNFFDLGGHSLLAIRVISAIRKEMGVEISINDIFDNPTIRQLATKLPQQQQEASNNLQRYDRPTQIPLSYSQGQLWFVDKLQGSTNYHLPYIFRLTGELNVNALEASFRDVITRHEVLRTVIREDHGKGYQVIKNADSWKLQYISQEEVTALQSPLGDHIRQLLTQPFDLSSDYMLKAWLIKVADDEHVLAAVIHHIAFDGWSMSILVSELAEIYRSKLEGKAPQLNELPVQYADYAIWQRKQLPPEALAQKLQYWKDQLKGLEPLKLPADYPRPAAQSIRGAAITRVLDKDLAEGLINLSRREGTTLFMTMLSVLKVLLHRYTGQTDIYTGGPIAGRQQKDIEGLIGFFINTLVIRSNINGGMSFRDLLHQVRQTTLQAYENQEVPFEKVVEVLGMERDMSRHPVFDVKFQVENMPDTGNLDLGEVSLGPDYATEQTAQMDISIDIKESNGNINILLIYCRDIYKQDTIERLMEHYENLMRSVLNDIHAPVGKLNMLGEEERTNLLKHFNDTKSTYRLDKTVIDLFKEQVWNTPTATALVYKDEILTYAELDKRSDQLASLLRDKGVSHESLVPVCMNRSLEMVIGILGIMKAGGAYVPVDPTYPKSRIEYIIKDTGAVVVLTDTGSSGSLPASIENILVDTLIWSTHATPLTKAERNIQPHELAYIIYTSGSMGNPKGVMVEHCSLTNYLLDARARYVGDALTQSGSYMHLAFTFDASLTALFVPLITGKSIVISSQQGTEVFNDENFEKYAPYDFLKVTPAHMALLENLVSNTGQFNITKVLVVGGEALHVHHFKFLLGKEIDVDIVNEYGPTEATVGCTTFTVNTLQDAPEAGSTGLSIGKPMDNVKIHIIDQANELLPIGIIGELCISSVQVARGYLHMPELTAKKFTHNPYSTTASSRLYRTGDLARWLPDGNIEFIGRKDEQVKIRGYMVEPAEVESALNQLTDVTASCVVVREDESLAKKLVAYYIPSRRSVKEREKDLYQKQVDSWNALYETQYSNEVPEAIADDEFNIVGWNDSFTGKLIPVHEMQEWVDDIVSVITADKPQHVLEIGCGVGLIFYRLANKIEKYTGTDFSAASVQSIESRVGSRPQAYCETAFGVCPAHEVTREKFGQPDTILLNSIVQYFPGEAYMTQVISNCIDMLQGNGRIVIGDVRDYRLLKLFRSRLLLDKLQESVNIRDFFEWHVEQEVLKEEELCFSPEYFYNLRAQFREITNVEIQWKRMDAKNELSLYRFTVVLHVGVKKEMLRPAWRSWNQTSQDDVISLLDGGMPVVAVSDVPNTRMWKERKLAASVKDKSVNTLRDLRDQIEEEDRTTREVTDIITYARARGYQVHWLLDEDPLQINLLMTQEALDGFVEPVYSSNAIVKDADNTNIPLYAEICLLLQRDIRNALKNRVPDYMVPADFVALQHLPLTLNGKTDKKFLARMEDVKLISNISYQAPVTPLEQKLAKIWEELLGVEKIGVYDNFFEHGGHSLLGVRMIAYIRKELGLEVEIKDLFNNPTIASLIGQLEKGVAASVLPSIKPVAKTGKLPLSFSQERLWFIDRLRGSIQYHMPWTLRLKGELHTEKLEAALKQIVQRHEVLRTVVIGEDGVGYQKLKPAADWEMTYVNASDILPAFGSVQYYIETLSRQPFDLSNDYMLRVTLIRVSEDEHLLFLLLHHIAFDGWSISIMISELAELYKSKVEEREPVLKELPVQYADYAVWQRQYISGDVLQNKLNYWKEQLQGYQPLELPLDFSRPAEQGIQGATIHKVWDKKLMDDLLALSYRHGATLFMTTLAAFKILLHRYSGQNDVVVGSPVAGRQMKETEGLIGFFINSLVLRTKINRDASFVSLLEQVRLTTLDAYQHQEIPFEKVVELLEVERNMNRHPVYDVSFQVLNVPAAEELELADVNLSSEEAVSATAQFDIGIDITQHADGLHIQAVYATDLFRLQTIERMLDHYELLLRAIVKDAAQPLHKLSLVTAEEEHQLLHDFNKNITAYPWEKTVVELFEEQVEKTPSATALIFENTAFTYKQLDEKANQLAHYLRSKNVMVEVPVAVCIERSAHLIIAILGILKAGGAYVPIDPEYPADRIQYMLDDTAAPVVICTASTSGKIKAKEIIAIDNEELFARQPVQQLPVISTAESLAYIMYTSGSTGKPKGVLVENRNIVSLVKSSGFVSFNNDDVVLSTGSPSFDATTFEYWGMLLNGGTLVMCPQAVLLDAVALKSVVADKKVSMMWFTAGWFNELIETGIELFAGLRAALVGGDKLSPVHISQLQQRYPSIQIINGYGPTENTTFSVTCAISEQRTATGDIPIGKPLANRTAYILDNNLQLCPIGVTGELCVGGDGLSRGYLNAEELTKEKFIANPFGAGRLYRTGDLARWQADGTIEYLGRKDDQVKLRGYRVEPGEVEHVLQQSPGIKQAVVVVRTEADNTKRLAAFIVTNEDYRREDVMRYLHHVLPDYMIPAIITEIETIPLTSNGKVDRRKLQNMEITVEAFGTYEAPRDEIEIQLANIWKDLLDIEQIGINDNFFELGGHSLLVMRMASAIRKEFNIELSVKNLFQLPTIAMVARYIKVNQANFSDEPANYETVKL